MVAARPREEEGATACPKAQGGGGAKDLVWARWPGMDAATPGRRRGPPRNPWPREEEGPRISFGPDGPERVRRSQGGGGDRRFCIRPREEEGPSNAKGSKGFRYKGRRHQGGGEVPPLLLQAPGGGGASQRNLFAVCRFAGQTGDHGAMDAKIRQLTGRKRVQLPHGLFVDGAAGDCLLHTVECSRQTVCKAHLSNAGGIYICHFISLRLSRKARSFVIPFGLCRAVRDNMGQLLHLHNPALLHCSYAGAAWLRMRFSLT